MGDAGGRCSPTGIDWRSSYSTAGAGKPEAGAVAGPTKGEERQKNLAPPSDVQLRQNSSDQSKTVRMSLDDGAEVAKKPAETTTKQASGSSWAVQINDMPAGAKELLQKSPAESETTPYGFDFNGRLTTPADSPHAIDKSLFELGTNKESAVGQLRGGGGQASGGAANRNGGSDQVQAIFVFRFAPRPINRRMNPPPANRSPRDRRQTLISWLSPS